VYKQESLTGAESSSLVQEPGHADNLPKEFKMDKTATPKAMKSIVSEAKDGDGITFPLRTASFAR